MKKIVCVLAFFAIQILFLAGISCKKQSVPSGDMETVSCGNLQLLPPGDLVSYNGDVYYIRYPDRILYKMNQETFEAVPFCQDPTCDHSTEKCAALGACTNLEVYKGKLYAANQNYQMVVLNGDRFERVYGIREGAFTHSGGKLFVAEKDSTATLMYSERGKLERVVTEDVFGYWRYRIGDYLYGNDGGAMKRIRLSDESSDVETIFTGFSYTDGSYLYQLGIRDHTLCRRDLEGKNPAQIIDDPVIAFNFDQQNYYFRYIVDDDFLGEKSKEIYAMRKEGTKEPEYLAALPDPVRTIYTTGISDWIYVLTTDSLGSGAREDLYGVNINSGEIRKITYPEEK